MILRIYFVRHRNSAGVGALLHDFRWFLCPHVSNGGRFAF